MLVVLLFFFFIFAFIVGGLVLKIIAESIERKGEMGINFRTLVCPKCGGKAKLSRSPDLSSQVKWGGGACSNCGYKMDKWGNESLTESETNKFPIQIEQSKLNPISTFDEFGKTPLERVFEENNQ